jgi:hypothetical protein
MALTNSQLLSEARTYIKLHAPYYMHALYNFIPYWDEEEPGVSITAGLVLTINPKLWQKLTAVELRAGLLVRNVHHVLRGMDRFETLAVINEPLAAIASEIPINDSLLNNKDPRGKPYWQLPPKSVTAGMFQLPTGKTREFYFDELRRIAAQSGMTFNDDGSLSLGGYTVGAGSTGPRRRLSARMAAIHATKARTEGEVVRIRREAIKRVQSYHQQEGGRGTMPGGMEEILQWTEEAEEQVVPWEQYFNKTLHSAVGRAKRGQVDYSKKRLSKRSFMRGFPIPGLISRDPVVLFVEDSSTSMGREQLIVSRIEIMGAMKRLGITHAYFMDADAAAQSVEWVNIKEIPNMPVTGRGGTNFAPAFEAARKLKPRPKVVVYMTDGDGYAPPAPPKEFEVIFCIVPSPWQKIPAPWGTTIIMSDDKDVRKAYRWVPPPEQSDPRRAPEHEVDEDGTITTTGVVIEDDDGEDGVDFDPGDEDSEDFDA